jgi:hypothetical protein
MLGITKAPWRAPWTTSAARSGNVSRGMEASGEEFSTKVQRIEEQQERNNVEGEALKEGWGMVKQANLCYN